MKGRNDKISVFLIVLLSFFLMADMYITPAIIPELTHEYAVSPEAIGWAGTAFMLLGAVIGLGFGYLNDKFSRKKLLIIAVSIGEIPCLLTGVTQVTVNFEMFVLMRTLTGVGIGGIYPLTFSLLSDYVSDRRRGQASAVVDIAWGLGIMSGPLLASFALNTEYGWRLAFIMAALPSFPLLFVYWLVGNEPQRGESELAHSQAHSNTALPTLHSVKTIFANRTNRLLFFQGIPGSLPWGLLPFWIITFFREERNMDAGDATMLWELFGICTVLGSLMWAYIGDKLFHIGARYLALMCCVITLVGLVPKYFLFNLKFSDVYSYGFLALLAGLLMSVASANIRAILMNVNLPARRGKVFALYNFFDSIGKGIGPVIGGVLLTATNDYQLLMNFAICFWLLCAAIFAGVVFTIERDRQVMIIALNKAV